VSCQKPDCPPYLTPEFMKIKVQKNWRAGGSSLGIGIAAAGHWVTAMVPAWCHFMLRIDRSHFFSPR